MTDALGAASREWVPGDEGTDHDRLGRALIAWANETIDAVPSFHGPVTARLVVAPPADSEPAKCLRLPLADDQVDRLVALLDRDMQEIGRAASRP
ncbi:hypothetical protein ACFYNO_14265 [Kitasatospora sp. NPDC006697]|uniref:hypothetical protein n=1 Tax=unclassified Kitasatospora TaxID=2633591 RepID=UPI0036CFA8B9